MVYENHGIDEGAASWFFPKFMRKSEAAALVALFSLESELLHFSVEQGVLTTYCQMFNHILDTYDTVNVIAKVVSELAGYVKTSNMSPLEF